MEFLQDHGFEVSKWLRNGIPFMNRQETEYLKQVLNEGSVMTEICDDREDRMDHMFALIQQIRSFQSSNGETAASGDKDTVSKDNMQLLLPFHSSINRFRNFAIIHRIRNIFPNFWIRLVNEHLLVKKISGDDEAEARDLCYSEEQEQAFEYMRGFSRVIQSIVDSRKVIVGHNSFVDLLFMYQSLIEELPKKLSLFKSQLSESFPMIYDTKHMSLNMKKTIPELEPIIKSTGLTDLYECLNVAEYAANFMHNPIIELMSDENAVVAHTLKKHDAGSDAFAAGFSKSFVSCNLYIHYSFCSELKSSSNWLTCWPCSRIGRPRHRQIGCSTKWRWSLL